MLAWPPDLTFMARARCDIKSVYQLKITSLGTPYHIMKLITLLNGTTPVRRVNIGILAILGLMAASTSSSAQTSFWSNATLNNVDTPHSWSTASNWTGNAVPSFGVGSTINFTTADIFAGTQTVIGANRPSVPLTLVIQLLATADGTSVMMETACKWRFHRACP